MSDDGPEGRNAAPRETPATARDIPNETLFRGGLTGVSRVTAATIGLALAGALIAVVISLLY